MLLAKATKFILSISLYVLLLLNVQETFSQHDHNHSHSHNDNDTTDVEDWVESNWDYTQPEEPEPILKTKHDSIMHSFEYQFNYKKEHYISSKYRAGSFAQKRIDIYKFNMNALPGFVRIPLVDSFGNQLFVFPVKGRTTSGFGPRRLYSSSYHYGLDVSLRTGTPVRAALKGVVRIVRNDKNGYGNFIVVSHDEGLETLYGHLSEWKVEEGDEVEAGDTIGLGGSTGRSSGPHLHFEFRFMGRPFNPGRVISFNRQKITEKEIVLNSDWFDYRNPHKVTKDTGKFYTIRNGDNLSKIARYHDTSITKLCKLNGLSSQDDLNPGQKVRIF